MFSYNVSNFRVTLVTQVHRVAADAECGYRFFVDAKHERFREVDGEQDLVDGDSENGGPQGKRRASP